MPGSVSEQLHQRPAGGVLELVSEQERGDLRLEWVGLNEAGRPPSMRGQTVHRLGEVVHRDRLSTHLRPAPNGRVGLERELVTEVREAGGLAFI